MPKAAALTLALLLLFPFATAEEVADPSGDTGPEPDGPSEPDGGDAGGSTGNATQSEEPSGVGTADADTDVTADGDTNTTADADTNTTADADTNTTGMETGTSSAETEATATDAGTTGSETNTTGMETDTKTAQASSTGEVEGNGTTGDTSTDTSTDAGANAPVGVPTLQGSFDAASQRLNLSWALDGAPAGTVYTLHRNGQAVLQTTASSTTRDLGWWIEGVREYTVTAQPPEGPATAPSPDYRVVKNVKLPTECEVASLSIYTKPPGASYTVHEECLPGGA